MEKSRQNIIKYRTIHIRFKESSRFTFDRGIPSFLSSAFSMSESPPWREGEGNREFLDGESATRRKSIDESINLQSNNPWNPWPNWLAENYVSQRDKLCTQSISQNASPPTKFGIRNAPLSLFLSLYLFLSIYTYIYTPWESGESFSKSFLEIYAG